MRLELLCVAAIAATPFTVRASDGSPGASIAWKQGAAAPPDTVSSPASVARPTQASSVGPHFGFSVAGAYEFGGDNLATVYFNDGSSQNLHAGQGILLAVGGHFQPARHSPWDLMLTAGYKLDHAGASNGDLSFDHIPVELIGSYRWGNGIRIGAGPVYHTNIEFKGSGDLGSAPSVKYKDAFGEQLQAGWKFVALTYTFIRYKPSEDYLVQNGAVYKLNSIRGDNFGIRFFYNF
jgi:hypothetical protein